MKKVISVSELEENLELYVEMAKEQAILITDNGKLVAKLVACEE